MVLRYIPVVKSSLRILAAPSISRIPHACKPVHRFSFRTTRFMHQSPPALHPKFTTSSCPSCSSPLPTPLPACTTCWYISPLPSTVTFHDIFGLPYHPNPFVIDISNLKQRFREAQAICHPDSWASKGCHKQDVAQVLSARINEAYQCLSNPLSRVEYILVRNHHPISENEPLEAIEFITEIMRERERIDDAGGPEQLKSIVTENDAKIQQTISLIEDLVEKQDWLGVKAAAIRLKYYKGIEQAGKTSLDEI